VQPPVDHRAYPVLVVDDEPDILEIVRLNYEREFTLHTALCGTEALDLVRQHDVAVLIADQRMPGMTGLEVISGARRIRPKLIPIILTGYTDVESLVGAINLGCVMRYIPKPFDPRELRAVIRHAIETFHLERNNRQLAAENERLVEELRAANERLAAENGYLKRRASGAGGFASIVGSSAAMQRVVERARVVAGSPTTVLLEGATGTGKELLARAIHEESSRAARLFVPVNVGTLTETLLASTLFGHKRGSFTGAAAEQKGLFEVADGGTIFLDEIGEASPTLQVHLLRVLQEGEIMPVGASRPVHVDVRVIAATNRDLDEEVRQGRFRKDLLHRLRVFPIRVPALAEHPEDIVPLAEHLIGRLGRKLRKTGAGFSPEAKAALVRHAYDGNVRELENLIERALLLCPAEEPISPDDLFERVPLPASATGETETLEASLLRFERGCIQEALAACGGNKTHAARRLGVTYRGLLLKMRRCGMSPP
jgi:two-component system response regulator HupR/HoxA